jgi:hypothetical protein
MLCVTVITGSGAAFAQKLTDGDVRLAKDRIEASYKAERAACDNLSANAKDICEEESEAKEKIAKAELEYRRTGTNADRVKLAMVTVEVNYEVAKERCDDLTGGDKDACEQRAKAARTQAEATAKSASK